MDGMLIDRYLPNFDVTIVEHVVIEADRSTTWQALRDLDLMTIRTPLIDAAMFVRSLPGKVASWRGHARPEAPPPEELKLVGDSPGIEGWLFLGENPQHEIALGAVGRFWQPDITWYDVTTMSPDEFRDFDAPGWGRIAASFTLRSYGEHRTLASYEARTATADAVSARRFVRYWTLVRPFVGSIMRAALSALADDAERPAGRDAR